MSSLLSILLYGTGIFFINQRWYKFFTHPGHYLYVLLEIFPFHPPWHSGFFSSTPAFCFFFMFTFSNSAGTTIHAQIIQLSHWLIAHCGFQLSNCFCLKTIFREVLMASSLPFNRSLNGLRTRFCTWPRYLKAMQGPAWSDGTRPANRCSISSMAINYKSWVHIICAKLSSLCWLYKFMKWPESVLWISI